MHEISLLENVREILQGHAQSQNFTRVKKVTLEIGRLSCVEPDALRFAFDVVMKDTLAEDAELLITISEGRGVCERCRQQIVMETLHDPCSFCGSPLVKITQGSEMKIKDLLVV